MLMFVCSVDVSCKQRCQLGELTAAINRPICYSVYVTCLSVHRSLSATHGDTEKRLLVDLQYYVIVYRVGPGRRRRRRRFLIDTEVRCVGAHQPFCPLEPARVKPN